MKLANTTSFIVLEFNYAPQDSITIVYDKEDTTILTLK